MQKVVSLLPTAPWIINILSYLCKTKKRLSEKEHEKLRKSWADKVYFSSHSSGRKKGVAILIQRQVNFALTAVHKDTDRRFILLNGHIDGVEVSLMNVYVPNEDDPGFI